MQYSEYCFVKEVRRNRTQNLHNAIVICSALLHILQRKISMKYHSHKNTIRSNNSRGLGRHLITWSRHNYSVQWKWVNEVNHVTSSSLSSVLEINCNKSTLTDWLSNNLTSCMFDIICGLFVAGTQPNCSTLVICYVQLTWVCVTETHRVRCWDLLYVIYTYVIEVTALHT